MLPSNFDSQQKNIVSLTKTKCLYQTTINELTIFIFILFVKDYPQTYFLWTKEF